MELSKCKIGIRPTIDGRWGGIREGLEEQTMGMAKSGQSPDRSQSDLFRRNAGAGCDRGFDDRRRPGSGIVRG